MFLPSYIFSADATVRQLALGSFSSILGSLPAGAAYALGTGETDSTNQEFYKLPGYVLARQFVRYTPDERLIKAQSATMGNVVYVKLLT